MIRYYSINFLGKVINILLILWITAILSHKLNDNTYAQYAIFLSFVKVVNAILLFGHGNKLLHKTIQISSQNENISTLLSRQSLKLFTSSIIIIVFLQILLTNYGFVKYLMVIPLKAFYDLNIQFLRGIRKYNLHSINENPLHLIVLVLVLSKQKLNLSDIYAFYATSFAIGAILMAILNRRYLSFQFDLIEEIQTFFRKEIKSNFFISLNAILTSLSNNVTLLILEAFGASGTIIKNLDINLKLSNLLSFVTKSTNFIIAPDSVIAITTKRIRAYNLRVRSLSTLIVLISPILILGVITIGILFFSIQTNNQLLLLIILSITFLINSAFGPGEVILNLNGKEFNLFRYNLICQFIFLILSPILLIQNTQGLNLEILTYLAFTGYFITYNLLVQKNLKKSFNLLTIPTLKPKFKWIL